MNEGGDDHRLSWTLEKVLGECFGSAVRVIGLSTRSSTYASSWTLRDVNVDLADGRCLSLVVKCFAPLSAATSVKPDFVVDPRREINMYRDLLSGLATGTAKFYGAAEDDAERAMLFLENVSGTPLWQVGDFSQWLAAARWLGRAHAQLAPIRSDPVRTARLLRYDESYYSIWPRRALQNFPGAAALNEIAKDYDPVLKLLAGLPPTIIHGEFHASNILVRDEGADRICVLDWETAAVGSGLMDLADLTSGKWDAPQRGELVNAYRAACDGAVALPDSQFAKGLRACRLHRALQWLGWSPDWAPPPQHAHDWLAEATDAWRELQGEHA